MKRSLSVILAVVLLFAITSCEGEVTMNNSFENTTSNDNTVTQPETATLVQYPTYPDELPRDYDYEVSVTQGDKTINLPVYNASRQINAYHSEKDTDSYRRFCEFAFEGEVTVSVKVKKEMTSYAVLPSSKGIDSTFDNGVITFKMTQPDNLLIRLNDDHNTILSIFGEAIEKDAPTELTPNVIYFKAGLNNLSITSPKSFDLNERGVFTIPSGYTVYLEPGALVTARLTIEQNAQNVKIMGAGSFLDPRLDRVEVTPSYMVYGYNVDNVAIENVKFLDAHCFNLCFCGIDTINIKGVKLLSSEISSDGITFWANSGKLNENLVIEDCYLYVNDNATVVTGAESLVFRNCTFGTKHGIFNPHGEVHDYNLENINVFRMGDFFRSYVSSADLPDAVWNVTGKNIYAEDALVGNSFILLQNQFNGKKTIKFENISLPNFSNKNDVYIINTTNLDFTCDNMFIRNGTKLDSSAVLTQSGTEGTKFTFGTSFDENSAQAGSYKKAVKKVNYKGEPTIKVGGYTLPFDAKGALDVEGYIPAQNVLKAINNKKDTTKFVKEVDGVKMLSLDFLRNSHNLTVNVNDNGVEISAPAVDGVNLLKNGGFENISHTEFFNLQTMGFSKTRDWTCFAFGELFEEKSIVKSGKSSIRVKRGTDNANSGIAQYVGSIIKTYGAGTYTFTAYVKLGSTQNASDTLKFGLAQANYSIDVNGNNLTSVKITNEWTKITHTVKITDPNANGIDHSFFVAAQGLSGKNLDFYIDDVALYFEK